MSDRGGKRVFDELQSISLVNQKAMTQFPAAYERGV
jgi:hypothetical protein